VVALAIAIPIAPYSFVLVPLAAAWGIARYRAAGWRLRDGRLAARRLLLARTTVLAPAAGHESVTLGQTVLQRRGRLADLVVAFGKRTKARVHHLDAADARDAFTALTGSPPRPTPADSAAAAT
jgi:putative membrane protein